MKRVTDESFLPPLWILTCLAVALFAWLLFTLKEMVVLLVVGYAIAYVIDPVLDRFEQWKISRTVGIFVLLGLLIAGFSLMIVTVLPVIADESSKLVSNFPQYISISKAKIFSYIESMRMYLPESIRAKLAIRNSQELFPEVDGATAERVFEGVFSALLQGYSITLTLVNIALLPFIVFYLAIDFDRLHQIGLSFVPKKYQKNVRNIAGEIHSHVSAFVRGQLLVGLVLFVLYSIGLGGIVRVDLWFLLAFISGFGNLVPYLGTLSGLVLSSVMALVTYGDFSSLLQVWSVYGVIQVLEGFLITPKIVGEKVGLSPLTVILAIFAFGKIFGLLGVFLAIPMAGAFRVMGRTTHSWVLHRIS